MTKTDPELFFLLLQEDVKNYIISNITIPEKIRKMGYEKIKIDYYIGSTGNISLNIVDISYYNEHSNGSLFSIERDGEYISHLINDYDLNLILELPIKMKLYEGWYDLFSIPEKLTLEEKITKALEEENYELLEKLKRDNENS